MPRTWWCRRGRRRCWRPRSPAAVYRARPDAELLGFWLADALLAQKLRWPIPVPLLMGQVSSAGLQVRRKPQAHPAGSEKAGAGRCFWPTPRRRRRPAISAPMLGAARGNTDWQLRRSCGPRVLAMSSNCCCPTTRCRAPGRAQNCRRAAPGGCSIGWANWARCASSAAGRRFGCTGCEGKTDGQAQTGRCRTSDLRCRAGRHAGRPALARMDEPHRGRAVRFAQAGGARGPGAGRRSRCQHRPADR